MVMDADTTRSLVKLAEECGELVQVICKKQVKHKDSRLDKRLSEEIADVLAACENVQDLLALDRKAIQKRVKTKLKKNA